MMNYTKWNDPKTYERMTAELAAYTVPETPIFAARDDEHIEHSRVQYCIQFFDICSYNSARNLLLLVPT